ncbi:MAG: GxxExxY protein [Sulfuricellaceae bacterium]|nr:GxxExxY protein [Sulfuricellaceae bacterium]
MTIHQKKIINHETHEIHEKMLFKDEVYAIQGAIFDVYREMGCGFLEAVYQECMVKELMLKNIPFSSQQELQLYYKGEELVQRFRPDFICFDKIVVELKAVSELGAASKAQLFNYLKASGLRLGLLVNFGHHPSVQIERVII